MQAKNIIFGGEIYKGIARGADCLANAVKTTLGPKGRYVVVAHGIDAPLITTVSYTHLTLPTIYSV